MKKHWLENKRYNKELRFLLIHPPLRFGGYANVPLGIALIAAMLEKLGFLVLCKDYHVEPFSETGLFELIRENNINVVGFSAMSNQVITAYKMANIIRKEFPHIKMIIGGHHATIMSKEPLKNGFDIVYFGDSEEALMKSIPFLRQKENDYEGLSQIEGISFNYCGNIVHNPKAEPFTELDLLPFPARHLFLFPEKYKTQMQMRKGYSAHIITSRGCVGRCFFCSNLYKNVAGRSAKNVVDEMEMLVKDFGVSQVFIQDDFASYNIERIYEICDMIKQRKLKVDWSMSNTRAESVDYKMFKKMKESGCVGVAFGIESGSSAIRKKIGKRNSLEDVVEAVKIAKKVGLLVGAFYIFGFPFETMDDMKETLKFAKKLNTPLVTFAVFCPFPGSPSFRYLKKKGKLKTYDWSQYSTHGHMLFESDNFTSDQVRNFRRHAYLNYHLSSRYIFSVIPLIIKSFRPYLWWSGIKFLLDFAGDYKLLPWKKRVVFE